MGLGEIPARSTMRAYYRLENANDSSGNGRTLTNVGTVTFGAGKFKNAANFGTVAIDKGLMLSTNPMSATAIPFCAIFFWFKMNSVANTTVRVFTEVSTTGTAVGSVMQVAYSITAGVMTITVAQLLSVTNSVTTYTLPNLPSTNEWIHLACLKLSTITTRLYFNGSLVASNTGNGTEVGAIRNYRLGIGQYANTGGANCFAMIDEYILEERPIGSPEIKKYYTQAKGEFLTMQ